MTTQTALTIARIEADARIMNNDEAREDTREAAAMRLDCHYSELVRLASAGDADAQRFLDEDEIGR